MAITRDQAMQEMTTRKLAPEHVEGVGWIVRHETIRVRAEPGATPEEAIERAVAHLTTREAQRQERDARRVIDLQQQGNHYHVPRRETVTDPITSERTERLVFDILPAAGGDPVVTGARHVLLAWADLAAAVAVAGGEAITTPPRPRER